MEQQVRLKWMFPDASCENMSWVTKLESWFRSCVLRMLCSVYSKYKKWNIMLAISVPGPILRKWPFLSANGVLATLLVIFHLSCEMSPSFTLFAPIPRNAMQSLESGFPRCYTFFMIIFNNSNIQNVFSQMHESKGSFFFSPTSFKFSGQISVKFKYWRMMLEICQRNSRIYS